ncbi:IclR family transcriptional regulator C-terminal domain-containing protein [Streptomyces sp. NPDC052052]|uniref:IclR family transcriptional regulator domain-containing protein n=1 Tax=Streptomyces sp. NPDC052052 TaxID=3154756 RepID=UPI0034446D3D
MARNDQVVPIAEGDFIQSLGKGLAVIRAFSAERKSMTLSEVAAVTGISKPSARRIVLTLQSLGYMSNTDGAFRLLPKVLDLGYAYISSFELPEIAQPHLDALNEQLGEVCSLGVLDGSDVIYLGRSQSKRVMSTTIRIGSRIDPVATAVGRVLLADLPEDELTSFLEKHSFEAYTEHTVTEPGQVRARLAHIRERGWELADQEKELGVRTIAAPITDISGETVAAVNIATNYMRVPMDRLLDEFLTALLDTAARIRKDLADYR